MTEVLAPCPFCGKNPRMRDTRARTDEGLWFVLIHECEALEDVLYVLDESYEHLVVRWNRRKMDD